MKHESTELKTKDYFFNFSSMYSLDVFLEAK